MATPGREENNGRDTGGGGWDLPEPPYRMKRAAARIFLLAYALVMTNSILFYKLRLALSDFKAHFCYKMRATSIVLPVSLITLDIKFQAVAVSLQFVTLPLQTRYKSTLNRSPFWGHLDVVVMLFQLATLNK